MMVQVLLCTLAALIGLPLGYFLGFVHTEGERIMDTYIRGSEEHFHQWVASPEVWR